jgi:MFS family permease
MAYQSNRCQLCWKFECSHDVCSAACCFSCFRYIYRMRLSRGLGGLIWVPMTSFWGRAPVLFWTAVIGMLFGIGAAVSKDFSTFHAMRACTGLFITAAQTISIAFIKDVFFFYERARKIGLWACLYIASPYTGPCFANFVVAGWRLASRVLDVRWCLCSPDLSYPPFYRLIAPFHKTCNLLLEGGIFHGLQAWRVAPELQ